MFRWKLWLVVAPVAMFVLGTLMASCGGGGGCFGSFNAQGFFIAGLCPTASPSPGFALTAINICPGPPPPTPTPTKTSGPTPTPTACPQATSTGVSGSGVSINFNAQGVLVKGKQTTYADITNAPSTLWTANNNPVGGPQVLQPPSTSNGGQYTGLNNGCACINVSSGGINGQPITVSVGTPSASCPACPTLTPTATPTATSTPKGGTASQASGASTENDSSGGTVLWTFDAHAPVAGPIRTTADGSAVFITADSMLHYIDAAGHEVYDRPAGGAAPAIGPDGTVFVQGTTSWLYALDNRGRPKWKANVGRGKGPLAADSEAVYANEDGNLVAISGGRTAWSIPIGTVDQGAAIPGGVVVAANGGDLTAVSSTGSTMWTFSPSGGFSGDLSVANGMVYAGSASGSVYALDAGTGATVWQASSGAPVASGPSVGSAGTVFFGSDALYAIDSSGATLWSSRSIVPLSHALAALSNATLFVAATSDSVASMLDLNGNIEWTARDLGMVVQVNAGASGVAYAASADGHVRALK